MSTVSPAWTVAPAPGRWEITRTPTENGTTCFTTCSPCASRLATAAPTDIPFTFGIGNVSGPLETYSVTESPRCTVESGFGTTCITWPKGTWLSNRSTRSTFRPSDWSCDVALATESPSTFGIWTGAGPWLTITSILVPEGSVCFAASDWWMTMPLSTVSL